jgi:anti-anti-sigma factor
MNFVMLEASFEESDRVLVVTPRGPCLDAEAAPELRDVVAERARGKALVVISLEHVDVLDCSGLAGLVSLLQRLPPGVEVRLVAARSAARELLAATHLDEIFRVLDDPVGALPR